MHDWALGLSCETPAASGTLQKPPKFHQKTPREGRQERILRREREKKRAKFWAVQGKGVQGKGGPGKGGPGKGGLGKGGSRGTEHDQTKNLKPPHGNSENQPTPHKHTQTHTNTHKHTQTHTNTHKHTQTQVEVGFGQSRFWPKSVLAKVGHTTETLTLAKVGLAKVGHDPKIRELSSTQARCNLGQFWLAPLTIQNVKMKKMKIKKGREKKRKGGTMLKPKRRA